MKTTVFTNNKTKNHKIVKFIKGRVGSATLYKCLGGQSSHFSKHLYTENRGIGTFKMGKHKSYNYVRRCKRCDELYRTAMYKGRICKQCQLPKGNMKKKV